MYEKTIYKFLCQELFQAKYYGKVRVGPKGRNALRKNFYHFVTVFPQNMYACEIKIYL